MQKIGYVKQVLVGKVAPFSKEVSSAINKQEVSGPQFATTLGFIGDEQADRRFHGGVEKAIHVYPSEHYAKWMVDLGNKPILSTKGAFGENISSEGVNEHSLCIADILQIGSTLVQVSQGRMPCWKLNLRFDEKNMAQQLQDTLRTGWYFRVLQEGEIAAGDAIFLAKRSYPNWSLAKIMQIIFTGSLDKDELKQLAELPLVESWKNLVDRRISEQKLEDWRPRLETPND